MKTKQILSYFLLLLCSTLTVEAQNILSDPSGLNGRLNGFDNHEDADTISKTDVPIGLHSWKVDNRFGEIIPQMTDTIVHLFQNENLTEGAFGEYNTTGNLGSPRISRLFPQQDLKMTDNQFIFTKPYDFFLSKPEDFLFTNTKSPFTNLTYHSCGNKTNGEDRIRAYFAKNAGKRIGMGFKIDYLYGRGYYDQQSTAHLDGSVFGYYTGDRYLMHLVYSGQRIKTTENGGLEDDSYVTSPENYSDQYQPADMPVRLTKAWNKMHLHSVFLTHRYNLGFTRYFDKDKEVKRDSLFAAGDSLNSDSVFKSNIAKLRHEFTPVAGFIHTLKVDYNAREYTDNDTRDHYYQNWILPYDSARDETNLVRVENTLAFEICEGFNKWAKAGARFFAKHEFDRFTLPDVYMDEQKWTYNYVTVGAQLFRKQGRYFNFNALGEIRTTGKDWGEFNVEAQTDFLIPIKKDSVTISLNGYLRNENPSFYYERFHGRNAWWDNSFDKMTSANVRATLKWRQTKLLVSLSSLQNYVYFQETTNGLPNERRRFGVEAAQMGKNVQVVSATLSQGLKWGILHWDNELTYQATSSKDVLPLPAFNAYSNLYLKFKIAKVLLTEFGADARFFTRYYAPAYSPIIGEYAVQDKATRVKTGNYPIVNAYVNFHLKRCRFYVMGSHVNHVAGSGRPFLTPHYPVNRLVFRFGISWNFFN